MLTQGTTAPAFSLLDQNGRTRSLSDYAGKYVLVYFYPKDDTPGCTKEACAIRDVYDDYQKHGVTVLGISADSPNSHMKFAEKYFLPFTLLSDPERKTIKEYGAHGGFVTKRISYLIAPDGTIAKVYPKVDPASHGGEILKDVYELKK